MSSGATKHLPSFLQFLCQLYKEFFDFSSTLFNTASSATPQSQLCREDAGIEPRTVVIFAFAVRHTNHSARSHPQSARSHPHLARSHPQTQLDLIHKLDQISSINTARSHPHPQTRLDLIHELGYISSTLGQISSTLG